MENRLSDKILKNLQITVFVLLILYFGRSLFVPMSFGLLVAIILYPLCRWLQKYSVSKAGAIAIGLVVVTLLFSSLLMLLIMQINVFRKDLPDLLVKLNSSVIQMKQWLQINLGFTENTVKKWSLNFNDYLLDNVGYIARAAVDITTGTFFSLFLIPVFAALFLYNRQIFVAFLLQITNTKDKIMVLKKLDQVIDTYFHFIKGMVLVYLIVGILNSIGLLILGIKHAILFGMLTAVMTIIPYVGIIIGALLPISVAWITKDSIWYPLGVIVVFSLVQYLEANIIFPKIVASQLKVSTWATLVIIIAGGLLWGVPGMILFIPFLGFAKIATEMWPECKSFKLLISE